MKLWIWNGSVWRHRLFTPCCSNTNLSGFALLAVLLCNISANLLISSSMKASPESLWMCWSLHISLVLVWGSFLQKTSRVLRLNSRILLRVAVYTYRPITVAARSKAWTVFARSDANRSQWPRGLRHELPSSARTLGSWVPIPLKAWMSVCVYSVFVWFFCVGSGLTTGWSPVQGVLPTVYRIEKLQKRARSDKMTVEL
jgi:hypothetical protein